MIYILLYNDSYINAVIAHLDLNDLVFKHIPIYDISMILVRTSRAKVTFSTKCTHVVYNI